MWSAAIFALLVAARVSASSSILSSSSFPLPSSLSLTHPGPSSPPANLPLKSSSTSVISTSSPTSSYSGNSSSHLFPSVLTTLGTSVLTEPGPYIIPVTSYPFAPFPSPSSEPSIPGVYPARSPKHPPPVESPALVPDFALAWTRAYQKAKAKVDTWTLEEKVSVTTGVD
ncbi:hypothetical protein BJV77DRAFT_725700 [Russula vinacea]|nr:hypothetical protein BJV77DRAFT_725700 [Russula vinacea]